MSGRFDWDRAREDLRTEGLNPNELSELSQKQRDDFLRKSKLNPDKYKSHDKGGKSDPCFLTSACVHAKNLPDDCLELRTLRIFRDSYMLSTEQGRAEVEHYYAIAPKIVEAIDRRPDSKNIWSRLFADVIIPAVSMIQNGQLETAHALYRNCVLKLQATYLAVC